MIPSAIVAEINNYGFDNVNYPDARIYQILTRANRRVCGLAPFPFTEKFTTWTETPATPATPLVGAPTDIRAVRNMGQPGIQDNAGNLSYLRRDYIEKTFGFNSYLLVDFPTRYFLWGKNSVGGANLYVWPYISIATIFSLDYHALPPVLSAATTEAQMLLPDAYCDVIQNMALAELARSDGDLDDATKYNNWALDGRADMMNDFESNQDTPDPMLYTDYDDYNF